MDAEQFLKTIKEHKATILHDCGIYRHVRCAKPDSGMGSWDVTTWPGYLCFSGDMGDFTFSRLQDMFVFFRRSSLEINEGYWAEKLQAVDRRSGFERWSESKFRSAVEMCLEECENAELINTVESEVLAFADDESSAIRAAVEFQHNGEQIFEDIYEYDCREYAPRFLFCCYAIVWTIQQYDAMKD